MPPLVQQLQDITDESPPGDLDRRLAKECIMGRMDGKVAIISGGARGMGAEEVRLFAREGAKVVFGDILDELGQQVEADCRAEGLDVAYTHLDVTSEGDWQAIVALAEDRYGKLDTLVNNAGISISVEGGARNISLEDTSVEQWDRVMDINSKGVFLGTRAAIPAMRRAGGGSIINISSIAGMTGAWSRSHPYNASKGAVRLVHQGHGGAARPGGHPRQLGAPGADHDADERVDLRGSRKWRRSGWRWCPWAGGRIPSRWPTACSTWRRTKRPS